MKKIIDYLPLLSICLVYFGFCNLHGYYKSFHVNIYAYVTTSEIIMAFFPALVFLSSIICSSLIQTFVGEPILESTPSSSQDEINPTKFKTFLNHASKSIFVWFITLCVLNLAIRLGLKNWFEYQSYDFQTYNIFAGLFFLVAMMWFMIYTDRKHIVRENSGTLAIIIVCYVGLQISTYRQLDAEKIKAGIPVHEMSFTYHGKVIVTNKHLLYIGQTSGHIFFYNRKAESTLVLKNADVDSLMIKN